MLALCPSSPKLLLAIYYPDYSNMALLLSPAIEQFIELSGVILECSDCYFTSDQVKKLFHITQLCTKKLSDIHSALIICDKVAAFVQNSSFRNAMVGQSATFMNQLIRDGCRLLKRWKLASSRVSETRTQSSRQRTIRKTIAERIDVEALTDEELDTLFLLCCAKIEPASYKTFSLVHSRCFMHLEYGKQLRKLVQQKNEGDVRVMTETSSTNMTAGSDHRKLFPFFNRSSC